MKKSFLLREIDPELWKNFKAACAHYDISMRDTFINHMEDIASDFNVWKSVTDKAKAKPWKGGKKR